MGIEIKHVKEGEYFIDEQREGPFSFWHHKHTVTEIEGGVLMEDDVHYKNPFGIFGSIANRWVVEPKIKTMFNYRY